MIVNFLRNIRLPSSTTVKNVAPVAVKAAGGLTTAMALAYALLIQPWEQTRYVPYLDSGGVPTACTGATGPIITEAWQVKRVFTEEECRLIDERNLMEHAAEVYNAITYRPLPDLTGAAFISFHYNVGPTAFRSSTLLKMANRGDLLGACNQLSRWTKVKGVTLRGLENRRFLGDAERVSERTVCLIGLDPSYRTPLFDKLIMKVK